MLDVTSDMYIGENLLTLLKLLPSHFSLMTSAGLWTCQYPRFSRVLTPSVAHVKPSVRLHCSGRNRFVCCSLASDDYEKNVWVHVNRKDQVTAMLECGMFVKNRCWLVVDEDLVEEGVLDDWSRLGSLGSIVVIGKDSKLRFWEDGGTVDAVIGEYRVVSCADDVREVGAMGNISTDGVMDIVMDALDWKIIPVENLIAEFQNTDTLKLIMAVYNVEEAKLMNNVMEHGTDGVMLDIVNQRQPDCIHEFRKYIFDGTESHVSREYSIGTVTRVEQLGMGDRICVDLAENMEPGQGFLLSSFARGFFLVHSECEETSYINSRPFRVNAGPVHSYIELGNKTGYLSELQSGSLIEIFDQNGNSKSAIVGRVKMEKRPLVLIEAKGKESGENYSIMLQNAETVKLVGPDDNGFRTYSVSRIQQGDEIYLFEYLDSGARHAGMLIKESIREY